MKACLPAIQVCRTYRWVVSRLPFAFDGTLYGCLCRPESVMQLDPGESVRFRALALVPPGLRQGPWTLAVEVQFMHGFDTARYQRTVSSAPVSLEVLDLDPAGATQAP